MNIKKSDEIISQFTQAVTDEVTKLFTEIEKLKKDGVFSSVTTEIENELKNGEWLNSFSGKEIYKRYCSLIKMEEMRVTEAYTQIALTQEGKVFSDIVKFFQDFAKRT